MALLSGVRFGNWVFAPTLLPTIAYLLLLALLLSLGTWQLGRAEQKWDELAARAEATRAEVVDLNRTPTTLATHEFRRVSADGVYRLDRQFLLDNQVVDRQVGYRILTPLELVGTDRMVLVDRGFIPIVEGRDQMPDLPLPDRVMGADNRATVTGRIGRGPSVGIRLGEPSDTPGAWPRRVQYLDFGYMADALGAPLADHLLIEGSLATDIQLRRAGRDAWRFGPERHEGYAVQWFSLAAALTVIWLVVNTRRYKNNRGST